MAIIIQPSVASELSNRYHRKKMKEKEKKSKCSATKLNTPEMLNMQKIFFSVALILSITLPILEKVSATPGSVRKSPTTNPTTQNKSTFKINFTQAGHHSFFTHKNDFEKVFADYDKGGVVCLQSTTPDYVAYFARNARSLLDHVLKLPGIKSEDVHAVALPVYVFPDEILYVEF